MGKKCTLNPAQLAHSKLSQVNWLRVNMALFELSIMLMPKYYQNPQNNPGSNGNSPGFRGDVAFNIDDVTSYLSHICDLFRI